MHRILIIGSGGIGKRHIRGTQATGRASVAIVEPHDERRQQAQNDYAIAEGWARVEEADLSTFDGAIICAPASAHIPLAMRCTEAGLPFLVEKPLAVTMDGVDALVAAVARRQLVARVGYVRRAALEIARMKEVVSSGELGDLKLGYINVSQHFPTYRPDYRETYYARPEMGGGCILDCSSHMIDLALLFFGPIAEVTAMYDHLVLPDVSVEDTALLLLRSRAGALVQISINQFQQPNTATIELIGSRRNLLLDAAVPILKLSDAGPEPWIELPIHRESFGLQKGDVLFKLQADAFLDAIEGKPDPLATLPEARDNLRIAIAARQADDTKRTIVLEA